MIEMEPTAPPLRGKLWTKDFSIITVGSIISMLGNAVAGFSLGILVFDNTGSTLLYALYFTAVFLPQIVTPIVAGPILDRFSRRKTIFVLDYVAGGLFLLVAGAVFIGFFNYYIYLAAAFLFGAINGVYTVAFDSFYPDLISPGNFSRAYSISSLIYPLANTVMVPIAGIAYETVGLGPLLLFNALTFIITATIETFVSKDSEKLRERKLDHYDRKQYAIDFREGLKYLKQEKGLLTITLYFVISMFSGSALSVVMLPYFSTTPGLSVMQYSIVLSVSTVGRLVGGFVHYIYKYPKHLKFTIAICVYFIICIIDGSLLYMPYYLMIAAQFLTGMLAVTSYNIRISATQNYVPSEKRGRFNGMFMMITTVGSLSGQLISGILGDYIPLPLVVALFMAINAVSVLVFLLPRKEYVKAIYNRDI